MLKKCGHCGQNFEFSSDDAAFHERISPIFAGKKYQMPAPTLCPDCRNQRRQMFRNDRVFYNRKCDLTGKQFISIFAPGSSYKIYHPDAWYGDKWNAMDFGRDYDFNRPFFEQLNELMHDVPRLGIDIVNCENSYYCNFCSDDKDCYLDIAGEANRDSYFNLFVKYSKDTVDCTFVYNSELCYECINCYDCYNVQNSMYCENCSDCYFCFDLKGCKNCIFSHGLRSKEYHIFNEKKTKEEYADYMKRLTMGSYAQRQKLYEGWTKFKLENAIFRGNYFLNCENCGGNDIKNSKNTFYSFNVLNCEDCKFLYDVLDAKDCRDLNYSLYKPELSYELISSLNMVKCAFSMASHYNSDVYYCEMLNHCANMFGCSGLTHKQYCILNKQYSKEEYEELVPRIIKHMERAHGASAQAERRSGSASLGEFFPASVSPFAYNETVANEYFPLSKENVLSRGWRWQDTPSEARGYQEKQSAEGGHLYKIPDNINDVNDDILGKVLICEKSGKPYKIIEQELKFYRRIKIPVPHRSPDQRHVDRINLRTPRHLFDRKCDKCRTSLMSPYKSDAKEKVFCDKCYIEKIY
ncbi:hypothetical protein A3B60_00815 [Candidatus Peregrinibacteria bacterium RIFCSPLOWO2_01_FULL_39_12]|nr:MAG: hypothetical protein A3B60_00815 [Candidatus Peregrinibacteria bacterium RIFCSPLOWO2_01_FULL_39_12]OGJ42694.1 MAG: hypothetical protein A3I58_00280 [Candidatus Peregrinibacteria bacterium RIFCSPLOWO2_02_FULL_39_10]